MMEDPAAENVPALFTSNIASSEAATRSTRTTGGGSHWSADDRVGIYMLKKDGSMTAAADVLAANIAYKTATGNSAAASLAAVNASELIYYPVSGNVDFISYYPYKQTGTQTGQLNSHVYPVTALDQSNPALIDLLYSNNVKNKAKSVSEAAGLQFRHRLSKIVINAIKGSGMASADFTAMTAAIAGMPTTASFALSNAALSAKGSVAAISMLKVAAGQGAAVSFEAIVIPQATGEFKNRKVTFTLNGSPYVWTIPDAAVFESGKLYTYNITVSETSVSGDGTILPWDVTPPQSGEGNALTASLILEGVAAETAVKVNFTDNSVSNYTLPADGIIAFEAASQTKTVRSVEIAGIPKQLIGRYAGGRIHLKFNATALTFRAADADGYIPIGSYAEFQLISKDIFTYPVSPLDRFLGNKYKQEADIDMLNEEWTPIGDDKIWFSGLYDGSGYTLSHLKITGNKPYTGLFGVFGYHDRPVAWESVIRNVHIISGTITGNQHVGSICGFISGTHGMGSNIKNCSNAVAISGNSYVGGICGDAVYGNISGCINSGAVTGVYSNIGGICGNSRGSIGGVYTSRNTGTVSGLSGIGGIIGTTSNSISNCYNTGVVTATSHEVGGICGLSDGSSNTGPMYQWNSIIAVYNIGAVYGQSRVGGICGAIKNISGNNQVSFWTDIAGDGASEAIGEVISPPPSGTASLSALLFGDGSTGTGWPTWPLGANSWKSLGGWNGGNPVYPKLYWEN
jgi:hypothetical protein